MEPSKAPLAIHAFAARCRADMLLRHLDNAVCDRSTPLEEVERLIALYADALRDLKRIQTASPCLEGMA